MYLHFYCSAIIILNSNLPLSAPGANWGRPHCQRHHLGYSVPSPLDRTLCHFVPMHLAVTWPRPEHWAISHLLSETCSPIQWHQEQMTTPRTNESTLLKFLPFIWLHNHDAIIWKMCLCYTACLKLYAIAMPIGPMGFHPKLQFKSCNIGLTIDKYYHIVSHNIMLQSK